MSSIGKTLAAACNWPADAVVVAADAEVAAGAAASVVAAGAGALAAEVAAAAVAAAAVAVASFSVAALDAWAALAARLAGLAAHPGERAACARSHEKRRWRRRLLLGRWSILRELVDSQMRSIGA